MVRIRRSPPVATQLTAWIACWLLALLAWVPTVQQARGMPPMPGPMPGTMGMPPGPFLAFWTLMMVAMMGPSLAPIVSLYLEALRTQARGPLLAARAGTFIASYFLIWAAFGLPVFAVAALGDHLARAAPGWALGEAALVLIAAGLYQMSPLQARCLATCNRHLGGHAHLPDTHRPLPDFRAGLAHGVDCLGACGGCMLALIPLGLMSLTWMFALTLIVLLEKVWRHGDQLAFVVGMGLTLLGILTAIDPRLLPGLYAGMSR